MTSCGKALVYMHCCLGIVGLSVPGAIAEEATKAEETKVEVCHIPPGNPDNARTITISENAVPAHLDHGDHLGACEARDESGSRADSACVCPRPGVWRVKNLDGWMECNALGIKRKLKGEDRNDDCSSIFFDAYEKGSEDVIMDRGRDCLFFGVAPGEEDGAEVIFDGAYRIENEEFIKGEYHMEMSGMGADGTGYRPFEIEFLEPLGEKDYAKQEKKMQNE